MKWEGMGPKLWGMEVGFLKIADFRAHLLDQVICVPCLQSLKLATRTHLVEFPLGSNPVTVNIFMVTISPVI